MFSGSEMVSLWIGRDEVVVEQQARDDRRAECGDEPADETDDYHGQEEQQ
jgi:hypothetical protein